ncbi:MAG: threonine--tRNA ligase [Bacilli bacterium]|nr:threonine--tRNA ligase [Bacilli bacterium]
MINIKEDEKLSVMNHSCAHLLAQAIKHLYPNAKFWVGPVIEEGFYYDIDLGDEVLTEEDLPKIEKEMKKCSKDNKRIVREEISKEEALERFKDDPYKVDLISRMDENEVVISMYTQGDFTDLCRGPHVESTKLLKNFKLLKVSGAYWKGDAKNKMLQRIYGICFDNPEDLEKHLQALEEAKERDHRKIGKDLGIYMMSDLVGRGLPMYLPNGFILWHELEEYIRDKEIKRGYHHVQTPPLGNVELYKTSGHLAHYKDAMFPIMQVEDEEYVLRPMNCPHHMVMYDNDLHSYRDLPLRIAEIARDCRYETSGSLKGVERVRTFCQNDSHIFCTPDQIGDEFKGVVDLILEVYKELGITDYKFELSLRDPEDKVKYHQDDEMWNKAEDALRKIMSDYGVPYEEMIGEAAFYGPKLDVIVKPAVGNSFALSTCQIDFCLPAKFDLTYVDKDGSKKTPVVLHRAVFGSIDRTIAYYLEETKGILPLWLAPKQMVVMPVNSEFQGDYAREVTEMLQEEGFRVFLDDRNEKLGYRLRESQTKKIPYTLILGDNEKNDKTISYRLFGDKETTTLSQKDFIKLVREEVDQRKLFKK